MFCPATGHRVLKSERNYNNGLGLPLSVLQMVSRGRRPDNYDLAVLEMGMSSPTHEDSPPRANHAA